MKKIIVLCLTVFVFASIISAQQNKSIESTIHTLFELAKKSDYKSAAAMIVFSGESNKSFSRSLNANDKSELRISKRICKKIKGLLKTSSEYIISNHHSKNNSATCQITFHSGDQNLEFDMEFVKLNNKYLLLTFK